MFLESCSFWYIDILSTTIASFTLEYYMHFFLIIIYMLQSKWLEVRLCEAYAQVLCYGTGTAWVLYDIQFRINYMHIPVNKVS